MARVVSAGTPLYSIDINTNPNNFEIICKHLLGVIIIQDTLGMFKFFLHINIYIKKA